MGGRLSDESVTLRSSVHPSVTHAAFCSDRPRDVYISPGEPVRRTKCLEPLVGGHFRTKSSPEDLRKRDGMRIRILRGAHEIGGSCVELETLGSRLVLDVGKPLWADWGEMVPLPLVPGLADGSDPSLAGVVISHPHLDHYGLVDQVSPSVPLYIGREAAALLKAAQFFSAAGIELHPTGYLEDRVPQHIGAFTVTPFLADHSAFDAYSLLVEAWWASGLLHRRHPGPRAKGRAFREAPLRSTHPGRRPPLRGNPHPSR